MGGSIPLRLRFKPSLRTRRGTSGEIVLVSRTGTVPLCPKRLLRRQIPVKRAGLHGATPPFRGIRAL